MEDTVKIEMEPVGFVHNAVMDRKDVAWGNDVSSIILKEQYRSGLKGLEDFSHVIRLHMTGKNIFREGRRTGMICHWYAFSPSGAKTGQTGSE